MIGVINYKAGNITSVCNALDSIGADHFVSNEILQLDKAKKIIIPGVGEAHSAMTSLRELGLIDWLQDVEVPFLGICLGMQVLFTRSDERDTTCLGIIDGTIRRFITNETTEKLKIPHMGWNSVEMRNKSPLFADIPSGSYFYFVHSYYAPMVNETIATTEYGTHLSSAVRKENFYGVQFHPEKSGNQGLQVLRNFIDLC